MKQKDPSIIRVVVINDSWAEHLLKDRSTIAWGAIITRKASLKLTTTVSAKTIKLAANMANCATRVLV